MKIQENLRKKLSEIVLTKSLNYFYAGNFTKSFQLLDSIDRKFNWQKEKENLFTDFLKNAIEVIADNKVVPYEPWIYEMINVNTFKAIDSLALKNLKHARVKFNRAFVREEEAKEEFKREIEKQMKQLEREKKKNGNINQENIDGSLKFIFEKYYSNLNMFQAYHGFLNPFTEYMGAVYFYSIGDYRKAREHFRNCFGIIKGKEPAEQFVASDFDLALISKKPNKYVGS